MAEGALGSYLGIVRSTQAPAGIFTPIRVADDLTKRLVGTISSILTSHNFFVNVADLVAYASLT